MYCKSKQKPIVIIFILVLSLVLVPTLNIKAESPRMLIPGGMPFGAKIYTEGLSISGFTETSELGGTRSPALAGGLKAGDLITSINSIKVRSPQELKKSISSSKGSELTVSFLRGNEQRTARITPIKCSDGEYRLGINVRDSMAGIGTVTFIDPQSGVFGGLGHGICEPSNGYVLPVRKGVVHSVQINTVIKGEPGRPGEIRGSFKLEKTGAVLNNSEKGIFGILTHLPDDTTKALPCAEKNEVSCGEASIISTLDNSGPKEYRIVIESIDLSNETKNFLIKVTDSSLTERSGGIVQGMSGSPIIQNGKIIGAVTHVMVNDPTKGYGIFIENMLKAVE